MKSLQSVKKRRVFVAIKISGPLKRLVLQWKNRQTLTQALKSRVRWTSAKNLHITLIPPWYETDIKTTAERLGDVTFETRTIKLTLHNISFGPDSGSPKLIWATGDAPAELTNLKKLLEQKLKKRPESRRFTPHLTLARFRASDFPQFKTKELNEKITWQGVAGSIVLMESHLSPRGAHYEILKEVKLRPRAGSITGPGQK